MFCCVKIFFLFERIHPHVLNSFFAEEILKSVISREFIGLTVTSASIAALYCHRDLEDTG